MANRSYQSETREDAYRTWRECGQNVEQTIAALKKKGYFTSKPTLYDWIEKYGWKERAARAEVLERKTADVTMNAEARALASLEKVQARYETYFETLGEGKVDNQAMYAYTGIVKSITEIKAKTGAVKATIFLDFMRDLIEWLGKNDPDSVDVIERN
ncbi:MAG: hypothetical protein ACYDHW_12715, partial [Syntrophorhabdaceae bacterium]